MRTVSPFALAALLAACHAAAQAPPAGRPAPGAPPPGATPPAPAAPPGNGVLPARGTYTVVGTAQSLSVFAVAVDAPELFTAIADKAGLPLVVDDTVSRKITVNIVERAARDVVREIVSAYGLSAADVDGVTMISEGIPRSPSSYLLSDIASIPTKYVAAANARNLLPVFLQDYVKVNSEQNAVVLSAPTEVLTKFREDIEQFDIPAAQIMVELLLVELTGTTSDQLGLNLTWNNDGRGVSINPAAGLLNYSAVTTLTDQFTASLRALQDKGLARVNAHPRIATVSGRQSTIFVGRQRYVATPIQVSTYGESRYYIDAGVRLRITPFTGGQGQVLINVDAEVSTLSAPDPITKLPEKSTRRATTVVRVPDGQTYVIGGLVQEEARDVRTKVPILGDIPLLGPLLFQSKSVRKANTELVLLITPRVLSATGHLPEVEEKRLKQRMLDADLGKGVPDLPDIKGLPTRPPKLTDPARSGQ